MIKIIEKTITIQGMSCASCELRIVNALKKLNGVIEVDVRYDKSIAIVKFDQSLVSLASITAAIDKLGYKVEEGSINNNDANDNGKSGDKFSINQIIGIGIIIISAYLIIKNTIGFNFIPQVNQSMGYGILFVVGLLTSLHCVAMCGGINISQCVSYKNEGNVEDKFYKLKPSLLYNFGRVISYTIIGGIAGTLGSVVSFSGTAKGIVAILSGAFMLIMGLNMLNIFPWLKKFNPKMPKIFGNKIYNNNGKHGPLYVGLLNGLMPCGPLQAMQLYALGTGSFLAGATSMFLFSLGTVPLMFGLGALSTLLSSKFTHRMLKVSAVLVMILGVVMISRGLNLSGVSISQASVIDASVNQSNIARIENGVQVVTTKLESGSYAPIIVQKGIPVKWTYTATKDQINGCNKTVTIPKYGIQKTFVPGDNIIEFTPEEAGNIPYTCWMGMISSNIKVVDDITKVYSNDQNQSINATSSPVGGSCCAAGASATQFVGSKIPTDNISTAKLTGDSQEITITVNDQGYSPAILVLQKGMKAKIKFNTEKLNSCNYIVSFPELGGQLDLYKSKETPYFTPQNDFGFQCGMGMLHGFVKVVENINNIDKSSIARDSGAYKSPAGSGGSCCGQ